MSEKLGILAIGHGSKLPYNKGIVESVANNIAKKHKDVVVKVGFMNMNEPTIEDALASFAGTGVTTIAAVPVFLASGVHITQDIPKILGFKDGSEKTTIKIDGKDVTIVYGKPLGGDELISDLVYKRAQEAL
ncbi:MAG: sirohydrochlorin nickelochelatase [Methanosarcinaceae archaeon]|nr:sirohydrochlorin nickelochelatase [Methanosarcinaceae archaeon]